MRPEMKQISKAQGKIEHFLDQEVPQIIGWMVIVAVIFLFLFFAIIPRAEAGEYRPPKQPERGAVEQVQNQDQGQSQGQEQSSTAEAAATASTDGNTQTLGVTQNYKDRAVHAVLGSTSADSDPGSTAPCLESRRSVSVWIVGVGGRTKLNERCWQEYIADQDHKRSIMEQRMDLERAKLLHELGYPSKAAEMLGAGGDKYTPEELTVLERDAGEHRRQSVHGDIKK